MAYLKLRQMHAFFFLMFKNIPDEILVSSKNDNKIVMLT